jgi:hypothetical protein
MPMISFHLCFNHPEVMKLLICCDSLMNIYAQLIGVPLFAAMVPHSDLLHEIVAKQ